MPKFAHQEITEPDFAQESIGFIDFCMCCLEVSKFAFNKLISIPMYSFGDKISQN